MRKLLFLFLLLGLSAFGQSQRSVTVYPDWTLGYPSNFFDVNKLLVQRAITNLSLPAPFSGTIGAPGLASTGVSSGTYSNVIVTVGGDGRVTAIQSTSPSYPQMITVSNVAAPAFNVRRTNLTGKVIVVSYASTLQSTLVGSAQTEMWVEQIGISTNKFGLSRAPAGLAGTFYMSNLGLVTTNAVWSLKDQSSGGGSASVANYLEITLH